MLIGFACSDLVFMLYSSLYLQQQGRAVSIKPLYLSHCTSSALSRPLDEVMVCRQVNQSFRQVLIHIYIKQLASYLQPKCNTKTTFVWNQKKRELGIVIFEYQILKFQQDQCKNKIQTVSMLTWITSCRNKNIKCVYCYNKLPIIQKFTLLIHFWEHKLFWVWVLSW